MRISSASIGFFASDRQLAGGRDGHPSRECQLPGLREHLPQRARSVLCPLSRAKLYTRYMDDIVIVAPDKETAREWLAKIKVFLRERLHLDTNKKTKVFYMRQGVNAYGFKIKATHMMLRTESKRREKRRVKAMVRKMREGKLTRSAVVQAVNSWLGFARWACAYNLAKKIFAPYRFIKTEGAIPYGAISRNRQARRLLQQRRDLEAPYKAVV